MDRPADWSAPAAQAARVLAAIASGQGTPGLRLNDIAAATGLSTSHVGRHLRTLEEDQLTVFRAGRWRATLRGRRVADELAVAADEDAAAPRLTV